MRLWSDKDMIRFNKKYEIDHITKCWNWIAGKSKTGYGAFKLNGKQLGSHRVSWMFNKGNIPKNMQICHKCDNRSCVNPDHLFLGNAFDNMQDAYNKGRMKNTFKSAEKHINSKLNWEKVREIRYKYNNTKTSHRKLAKEYNISYHQIQMIVRNLQWKG